MSNGVAGIRTVLGYSGDINPLQKTHLIMFVGYESSRSTKIIELLEPSLVSLGYGLKGSSTNPNHEKASKYFHKKVEEMVVKLAKVTPFPFSCNDPFLVRDSILDLAKIERGTNVVVAPMNTKLSTIGAGLAALKDPSIQLCYAPALQYNFKYYSEPTDTYTAIEWIS